MKLVFLTSVYEFGIQSLESLIEQGEEIASVILPPLADHEHRGQAVKETALAADIPVYEWKGVNSPERIQEIKSWKADLAVSAGNMQFIFKPNFLEAFPKGAINYHCSLLPENGGMFPVHWQIYKGLDYIGITIHQCAEEIDRGEIILQKKVPIEPDAGFKKAYFGKVLAESVFLLSEAVRQIREGTAQYQAQDLSKSTYNPPFGPEQWTINWADSAQQVYNVIRACDAWPGALTTIDGEPLKIWQAALVPGSSPKAPPGTILEVRDEAVIIQGNGANLRLERIQVGDGAKYFMEDFPHRDRFQAGGLLGN